MTTTTTTMMYKQTRKRSSPRVDGRQEKLVVVVIEMLITSRGHVISAGDLCFSVSGGGYNRCTAHGGCKLNGAACTMALLNG